MSGGLRRLYRGEIDLDFLGRRRIWFAISGTVVLLCLATLFTRGLNYGIEFEGGVQIQADIAADGPLADASDTDAIREVRNAIEGAEAGAADAQIQVITDDSGRRISVQTKETDDPEAQEAVIRAVRESTGASAEETDSQRIGSRWGAEITDKALRALVIFLLVILVFISWRFEWKMALAAIIALAHDLVITAGVYSIVGFEVTPASVIAILTILGYSLYDSVVVFDKVEENVAALAVTGRKTYEDAANMSLNQVFMRSLNTSLTTLLPVTALLVVGAGLLGAHTLKDLALALLVGILVGTYSSIFVATPVLTAWKEGEEKFKSVRQRLERGKAKPAAAPARGAEEDEEEEAVESRVPAGALTGPRGPRGPARPRTGSKKARRRKRR
jgi:preprotein translocase subunit SecF